MFIELGNTGIRTSALALGCAQLGSVLTPLSRRKCINLLSEAFDLGIRHFDTANIYGQGDSERYIGSAFKDRRHEVCLSTKAGQRLSARQLVLARAKMPLRFLAMRRPAVRAAIARRRSAGLDNCFVPAYITASIEGSLRRLRTDVIDIFYLHGPSLQQLQTELLWHLGERLLKDGKIRCFGVSCDEWTVAMAAAVVPEVQAVQFDIADNNVASATLALAAQSRKFSLVRGIGRSLIQSAQLRPEALESAFRHAMALPSVAGVIVGTTSAPHLRQNVAAFNRACG